MTTTTDPGFVPAYGFHRPDSSDARSSLERLYGAEASAKWAELLRGAGLDASRPLDAEAEFGRIVDAFLKSADPVVCLCGQALKIRRATYRHLSEASTHIGGAS
jgi:hypothetical protein